MARATLQCPISVRTALDSKCILRVSAGQVCVYIMNAQKIVVQLFCIVQLWLSTRTNNRWYPTHLPQMVRTFDPSFGKHHRAIIDHAVGGGIVCSLGEQSLRTFLTDISITLKPQQDIIIQALDELRRSTDAAVTALEESGSPYKHAVVRNLRTHHAAYVTFTKVCCAHLPLCDVFQCFGVLCVIFWYSCEMASGKMCRPRGQNTV